MKVVVYLEGPSDELAMKALLRPLLEEKARQGVRVRFVKAGKGDGKAYLLNRVPALAATELPAKPDTTIVVMPDLYPSGKSDFKDERPEELAAGVLNKFRQAMKNKGRSCDTLLEGRFRVFCFKHEMEVLLLAAAPQLGARLGVSNLKPSWVLPPENQNHGKPPKHVVQELFRKHRNSAYEEKTDAPMILAKASYQDLTRVCDQCFKPFVEFLESCGVTA